MTVKELIEILEGMPKKHSVVLDFVTEGKYPESNYSIDEVALNPGFVMLRSLD